MPSAVKSLSWYISIFSMIPPNRRLSSPNRRGDFVSLSAVTEEHYSRIFDTNVKGTLFTVHKVLPVLKERASIILTGSTSATTGVPELSVYRASKTAVRNFARAWIIELAPRKIRLSGLRSLRWYRSGLIPVSFFQQQKKPPWPRPNMSPLIAGPAAKRASPPGNASLFTEKELFDLTLAVRCQHQRDMRFDRLFSAFIPFRVQLIPCQIRLSGFSDLR